MDMKCILAFIFLSLSLHTISHADSNIFDFDDPCSDCFVKSKIVKKNSLPVYQKMLVGGFIQTEESMPNIAGDGKPKKTTVSTMNDLAKGFVEKIPDSMLTGEEKLALYGYLDLLGAKEYVDDESVGGSNRGINAYFHSLWENTADQGDHYISFGGLGDNDEFRGRSSKSSSLNQCFRDRALNFYRDVSVRLKTTQKNPETEEDKIRCDVLGKNAPGKTSNLVDYGCPKGRPGLFSKIGDKDSKDLEPGWLWKLALKNTNGNAYAAMHLIGMCGHDDTAQSELGYTDESEAAKSEIFEKLKDLKSKKIDLEKKVKSAAQNISLEPDEFSRISREFERILKQIRYTQRQKGVRRVLSCPPQSSAFYAPGGLAEDADISPELKNKISKIQNPNGNLKIPAKHYHVYGSAFMACSLITNGFDPKKAVTVQKQAARVYRGTRMCESSNRLLEEAKEFENTLGKSAKRSSKTTEDFIVDSLKYFDLDEGKCTAKDDETNKICKKAFNMFGEATFVMKADPALAKRKILNRMARLDAAQLYNSWYVGGGSVFGKKIPCTDIRLGGPQDLMNANNSIALITGRPDGWSKERYDVATKHLATWDVDFEWTVAQHEAGAKFAAKNCKKNKPGENPFQNLCSASQSNPSPSPSGDGKTQKQKSVQ